MRRAALCATPGHPGRSRLARRRARWAIPNVAGVLGYCVKNKLLGDGSADSVIDGLKGKAGVTSAPEYRPARPAISSPAAARAALARLAPVAVQDPGLQRGAQARERVCSKTCDRPASRLFAGIATRRVRAKPCPAASRSSHSMLRTPNPGSRRLSQASNSRVRRRGVHGLVRDRARKRSAVPPGRAAPRRLPAALRCAATGLMWIMLMHRHRIGGGHRASRAAARIEQHGLAHVGEALLGPPGRRSIRALRDPDRSAAEARWAKARAKWTACSPVPLATSSTSAFARQFLGQHCRDRRAVALDRGRVAFHPRRTAWRRAAARRARGRSAPPPSRACIAAPPRRPWRASIER